LAVTPKVDLRQYILHTLPSVHLFLLRLLINNFYHREALALWCQWAHYNCFRLARHLLPPNAIMLLRLIVLVDNCFLVAIGDKVLAKLLRRQLSCIVDRKGIRMHNGGLLSLTVRDEVWYLVLAHTKLH